MVDCLLIIFFQMRSADVYMHGHDLQSFSLNLMICRINPTQGLLPTITGLRDKHEDSYQGRVRYMLSFRRYKIPDSNSHELLLYSRGATPLWCFPKFDVFNEACFISIVFSASICICICIIQVFSKNIHNDRENGRVLTYALVARHQTVTKN